MLGLVSGQFIGMSFEDVMAQLVEMDLGSAIDMDELEQDDYILVQGQFGDYCEMYFDEDGVCDYCVVGEEEE